MHSHSAEVNESVCTSQEFCPECLLDIFSGRPLAWIDTIYYALLPHRGRFRQTIARSGRRRTTTRVLMYLDRWQLCWCCWPNFSIESQPSWRATLSGESISFLEGRSRSSSRSTQQSIGCSVLSCTSRSKKSPENLYRLKPGRVAAFRISGRTCNIEITRFCAHRRRSSPNLGRKRYLWTQLCPECVQVFRT